MIPVVSHISFLVIRSEFTDKCKDNMFYFTAYRLGYPYNFTVKKTEADRQYVVIIYYTVW